MYERKKVIELMRRLTGIRTSLLSHYPFYGQLLMALGIGLAPCGTACTDMRQILFDPEFTDRLDDEELMFVMIHEVMHCALKHCARGRELDQDLYNTACDIVVNSNILKTMGVSRFVVDGEEAMCKGPSGEEGYKYTAEEMYQLLLAHHPYQGEEDCGDGDESKPMQQLLDSHDSWEEITMTDLMEDTWDQLTVKAAEGSHGSGILPPGIRKLTEDYRKEKQIDWRRALHDFVHLHYDHYDYSFIPPDKRFSYLDCSLPAFQEIQEDAVDNIWFVIDASGSVSDDMLNIFYHEVTATLDEFTHLTGKLSFFSDVVTEPVPFSSIDELKEVHASGGGGTSFYSIFRYMKETMSEKLPTALIILTDGYAAFPPEKMAMGVPVLWVICDSGPAPEWGAVLRISTMLWRQKPGMGFIGKR